MLTLTIKQMPKSQLFLNTYKFKIFSFPYSFAFKPFPVSWIHVANSEAQQCELNQASKLL